MIHKVFPPPSMYLPHLTPRNKLDQVPRCQDSGQSIARQGSTASPSFFSIPFLWPLKHPIEMLSASFSRWTAAFFSTAQSPPTRFSESFGFILDRHRQKRGVCIEVCIQSILTFARSHARNFPERHRGSKRGPAKVRNLGTGCAGCVAQSRVEQVLGKWESQLSFDWWPVSPRQDGEWLKSTWFRISKQGELQSSLQKCGRVSSLSTGPLWALWNEAFWQAVSPGLAQGG